MNPTPLLLRVTTLSLLAAAPGPARAQWRVSYPGQGQASQAAYNKVAKVGEEVGLGERALPERYGDAPDKELAQLEEAAKHHAKAREMLSSKWQKASNYTSVEDRLRRLEINLAQGRLAQSCSAARKPIVDGHAKGELATDAQLQALDAAVARLEAGTVQGWERALEWWKQEAGRLRTRNPQLAVEAKRAAEQKAREDQAKQVRELTQPLKGFVKEFGLIEEAGLNAIAEPRLAEYAAGLERARAAVGEGVAYYETRLADFAIYNAWYAADPPVALAEAFQGHLEGHGESQGKALKATFAAQADWCYVMATRWQTFGGSEKVDAFEMTMAGGSTPLQAWSSSPRTSGWGRRDGVCATKAGSVTASAELTFPGSKNRLLWVVVGWPRAELPMHQAVNLQLHPGDPCDAAHWYGLWTNPVPGTLVYDGVNPVLLLRHDGPGAVWTNLLRLDGSEGRARKHELTSAPPERAAFKATYRFQGCHTAGKARHADSVKLGECKDRINKKYDALEAKYSDQEEYARTIGGLRTARQKLDRLGDEEDAEYARACGPLEKKIDKACEKAFSDVVDAFADHTPPSTLDRAARMALEEAPF